MDLTDNDNLRAICLPPACIRTFHQDLGAGGRFPQFLAQISSPYLEEVFMEITVTSLLQLNVIDWQTIGLILQEPNFLHLKRVQVTIRAQLLAYWRPEFKDKAVAWLEDRLPECRARGILEVKLR